MRSILAFVAMVVACFLFASPVFADVCSDTQAVLSGPNCTGGDSDANGTFAWSCTAEPSGTQTKITQIGTWTSGPYVGSIRTKVVIGYIDGYCQPPPDCGSLGGQSIPAGTSYDYYAASGASCKDSCFISMVVNIGGDPAGGLASGSFVYTGQSCPVTLGATNQAIQAASETYNPDGSKTYCDTVSGKCVTAQSGAAPPASASSSGSVHSTDSTASTTTGATTSTSTSTTDTTYTPDGSSGTGGGFSGTSTATTTTTTDNPASASSTATKCTTGVCDVGDADGQIGGIYSGSANTPGQAYQAFVASVRSAPIVQAATSFFTVNVSGTCPTWHLAGNPWWGASGLDFTLFCDPAMLNLLALAGLIVLATAAFSAFRIAVY